MSTRELSEKQLIQAALDHMSEALALAFETQSDQGHALCWMIDNAIKYGTVICHAGNVLSATADYTAYEQELLKNKGDK